jgi:hypothetical protein
MKCAKLKLLSRHTTFTKQRTGSLITKPVLFISYWKDMKEGSFTILFMTKS